MAHIKQLKNLDYQHGRIDLKMKELPLELVVTLISGLYIVMIFIWDKMDKIWKTIGHIEKDYVEHGVCEKRRKDCPCKEDIKEIKHRINF